MLAVMLSQQQVSSSKIVRPRAPCGARCMGHAIKTWSAVYSAAPHLQFGEGARSHLCMDIWNRPAPVPGRLSLTQAVRGKLIPTDLALVLGIKTRSLEIFSRYSAFHLWSTQKRGCQVWQGCPKDSVQLAQTGVWILVSLGEHLSTYLKDHKDIIKVQRPWGKPRRVSLPVGKSQLAGCLKVWVSGLLELNAGIQ